MSNVFYNMGQFLFGGRGKKGWNQLNTGVRTGTKGPVWIDTDKPDEIFLTIPQVQLVYGRKAAMFSNMEIKEINEETGEDVTSPEFLAFLEKLNPLQKLNQFLREYSLQYDIYGNAFMYKSVASSLQKYPTLIWNLPPADVQPVLTGKVWDQKDISGIISGYQYQDGITRRIFEPESILYTKQPDPRNPLKGLSPLMSLKYPCSNILAGYKFENCTMEELGGIGMITGGTGKDAIGSIGMTSEQKIALEKQLRKDYGIEDHQSKIHIVPGSAAYYPMSYPVKDMMLIEARDANFMTIVDHARLNINIFSTKNSTYENLKNGILLSYQDCIQPAADEFIQHWSSFIGQPRKGIKRIASYEHIPVLKHARALESQSIGEKISAINEAVQAGFITLQEGQAIIQNELKLLKG